jgi:hypothetical protein
MLIVNVPIHVNSVAVQEIQWQLFHQSAREVAGV